MDKINRIIDMMRRRRAEKKRCQRKRILTGRFTLAERGGEIFVLCDDVAVSRVMSGESIHMVMSRICEMRDAALRYAGVGKEDDFGN